MFRVVSMFLKENKLNMLISILIIQTEYTMIRKIEIRKHLKERGSKNNKIEI